MTEQEEFEFRSRLEQEQGSQPKQNPGLMSELGRQVGLTARAGVAGLAGLPLMLGDVVNTGLNQIPGVNLQLPSKASQDLMTKAGLPVPANPTERAVQEGAEALTGTGALLKGAQALGSLVRAPVASGVISQIGSQPVAQLAAAAPSAAAAQAVGEATGSPVAGMTAGVLTGGVAGLRPRQSEVAPLASAVKEASTRAYSVADQAGIMVKPSAFSPVLSSMRQAVENKGFDRDLHPAIARVLNRFEEDSAKGTLTLSELDRLRQVARNAVPASDDNQKRLSKIVVEQLDNFVNNMSFKDVNSIDPKVGVSALKEARDSWSKTKKAEVIDNIINSSALKASKPGASEADILRNALINLSTNNSKLSQFSTTEQNMIKAVAKGSPAQNFLEYFAKLSPTQGGAYRLNSLLGAGVGAAALGPAGAVIVPALGMAAKQVAAASAQQRTRDLQSSLLLGRPLQTTARNALVPETAMRGLFGSYGLELPQGNQ